MQESTRDHMNDDPLDERELRGAAMMTRRTAVRILLSGPLLLLVGCKEPKESQQRSAEAQEPRPRPVRVQEAQGMGCSRYFEVKANHILLLIFDRSGSVQDGSQDRFSRIRTDAANFVQRFPSATIVLGRYISNRSYSDAESFLEDAIPAEPPALKCEVTNPFDPAQRRKCQLEERRYQAQLQCVEEARKRIAAAFLNLTPPRAQRSDIWGAIAAAAEILSAYPANVHKMIVIYSDLVDNVRTPLPESLGGLKGVEVVVRTATNGAPAEVARRVDAFRGRLSPWGANVKPIPLNVPMTMDELFNDKVELR